MGRDKTREHTCNAYIVKSNNGSKEKNIIQLNQDVHVCGMFGGYMVANLILLCSLTHISFLKLGNILQENRGYLYSSLFFLRFFSSGHLSTHCFKYSEHLCVHFFSFSFFLLFFKLLHSPMSFSTTNLWERFQQQLGAFILSGNLTSMFLCLPQCRSRIFLVDLNGRHIFAPTPSIRVVERS
jgi:hypothetical protein